MINILLILINSHNTYVHVVYHMGGLNLYKL